MLTPALLERVAEKFRLLGDPSRLAILSTLMNAEKCVGQIVKETGQGQANVSKHLKHLHRAGIVARRKEGLQVFYRVIDPLAETLCRQVCEALTHPQIPALKKARSVSAHAGSLLP
jgi:ArsR family transcriptional regulator